MKRGAEEEEGVGRGGEEEGGRGGGEDVFTSPSQR